MDGYQWASTCVDGPKLDLARSTLWDELAGLINIWDLPWYVGATLTLLDSQVNDQADLASILQW